MENIRIFSAQRVNDAEHRLIHLEGLEDPQGQGLDSRETPLARLENIVQAARADLHLGNSSSSGMLA